jgi:hypothetical protein
MRSDAIEFRFEGRAEDRWYLESKGPRGKERSRADELSCKRSCLSDGFVLGGKVCISQN